MAEDMCTKKAVSKKLTERKSLLAFQWVEMEPNISGKAMPVSGHCRNKNGVGRACLLAISQGGEIGAGLGQVYVKEAGL